MTRSIPALLLALLISAPPLALSQTAASPLVIAAGSSIELVNTRVVWMASVKPGEELYLQVFTSLMQNATVALPAGTYVQGTIVAFTLPQQKVDQATMHIRLDKLIFPNGYNISLSPPPVAMLTIDVSANYDVLLDNGSAFDLTLTTPLSLDAQQVVQAVPLAIAPGQFKPGTTCRDTPFIEGTPGSPGSSGTPDIDIPGNPGTPDIDIPGTDGEPDTIIPGTPATPDTIIPGTPATPDDPGTPDTPATFCPPPPLVVSATPE
jgi:hypothetical protein